MVNSIRKNPPGLKWGNQPRKLNTVLGGTGAVGSLMNGDEGDEGFTFGLIDEVAVYNRAISEDESWENFAAEGAAEGATAVQPTNKLAHTWER